MFAVGQFLVVVGLRGMQASLLKLSVRLHCCRSVECPSVETRRWWHSDLSQKVLRKLCSVQTCHQNFAAKLIQESKVTVTITCVLIILTCF